MSSPRIASSKKYSKSIHCLSEESTPSSLGSGYPDSPGERGLPTMLSSLPARRAVVRETQKRYLKCRKTEKSRILAQFCALTQYRQAYTDRTLRGKPLPGRSMLPRKRNRTPRLDLNVAAPLRKICALIIWDIILISLSPSIRTIISLQHLPFKQAEALYVPP